MPHHVRPKGTELSTLISERRSKTGLPILVFRPVSHAVIVDAALQ